MVTYEDDTTVDNESIMSGTLSDSHPIHKTSHYTVRYLYRLSKLY